MRRVTFVLTAALVCSLSLGFAFAGGETCAQKAAVAKSGCCASEGFPSMAMMVGEKSYNCPMEAGKAAQAAKAKVVYVVGSEKFDCQDKAMAALADASESYVRKYTTLAAMVGDKVMFSDDCAPEGCCAAMAAKSGAACCAEKAKTATAAKTVKADDKAGATCSGHTDAAQTKTVKAGEKPATCEKSTGVTGTTVAAKSGEGCCASKSNAASHPVRITEAEMKALKNAKYMIAGRTFDKYDDAVKTRDQVRAAIKKIAMTYEVDGKKVDSADKVCPMAKKDGKVQFVVADKKTKCEIDARISLAKAQYEAARNANGEKIAKM